MLTYSTLHESSSYSSSSSFGTKREQLPFLQKSFFSRAKAALWHFFGFAFSTYPIFPLFTNIMVIVRSIQFIIPTLLLSSETMYPQGTIIFSVARVLSFPMRVIPIGHSLICYRVLGWILFGVFLGEFILLIAFMMIFSRKSELPKFVSYYLVVVNVSIGNILKPILMSCATVLITSKDRLDVDLDLAIFLYILFVIFSVMDFAQNLASLYFFPEPFVTCRQHCQSYINILVPFIFLFSELATGVSFTASKIIFPVIMIVLYSFLAVFISYFGILIQKWEKTTFLTAMTSSVLFCICSTVLNYLEKEVPLYMPLIYLGVVILVYIIYAIFFQRMEIKSLIFLDEMERNPEEMRKVSVRRLNHIIIDGCNAGHQYCTSFNVFNDVLEVYPRTLDALILFAKFLAIYPEESHQLSWVLMRIKRCDCSKYMKKYLTSQITALLMKRDISLSVDLKKKMQVISSLIISAKLRIRNALESSMNGNTGKLISLFSKVTTVIDQINIRFANLRSYHRSNQYALYQQASFTKDVLGDYKLADQLKEIARLAQSGQLSTVDQPYRYGRLYFPNFPSKLASGPVQSGRSSNDKNNNNSRKPSTKNTVNTTETKTNTNTDGLNHSSQLSDYGDLSSKFDFPPEILNLHSQIKASIDTIKIPSITHSIIFFVGNVLILAILPLIINAAIFPTLSKMISNPAQYLTVVTQARSSSMTAFFAAVRFRVELSNNIEESFCPNLDNISEALGGSCDVQDQLLFYANRALKTLSSLPILQLSTSSNVDLKKAQELLFTKQTTFQEFEDWTKSESVQRTPFNELLNLLETMISVGSKPRGAYDISHKYFANIIRNFEDVLNYLQYSGEYLTEFLYSQVTALRYTLSITRLVIIIAFPILNIIFLIFYSTWLSSNQQVIFQSFTALPKSTIAQMMQKLEVLSRRTVQQQSTAHQGSSTTETNLIDESTDKNNQTEKIISILHTSQNDFYNSNIIWLICLFLTITVFEAVFLYITFTLYISGSDSYMKSTPHIQTIVTALVDLQKLATSLAFYSNHQNHLVEVIEQLNNSFMETFNECKDNFHLFYFGNSTMNYDPIITTTKSLFVSLLQSPHFNEDSTSIDDLLPSFSYDLMFYYLIDLIRQIYSTTFLLGNNLDPTSDELQRIIEVLIYGLYPKFFVPLYKQFTLEVSELISKKFALFYTVSVMLVLLIVISLILLILLILKIRKQMISVLRILLLAPPNVLIQSRYIMMLLSGTFRIPQQSLATLDDGSFSTVLDEFPSCVIKCDTEGNVITMNRSAKRIIGHKIKKIKLNTAKDRIELNGFVLSKSVFVTDDYAYVILTDITEEDKYQQKIKEEEKKHKELLKLILPHAVLEERDDHYRLTTPFQIQTTTMFALSIDTPAMHARDKNQCPIWEGIFKKLPEFQTLYPAVDYLDVNMSYLIAATGFFTTQFTAEMAANQMLNFASSVISFCKELKTSKKDEIMVQAGMITGGPVIAGVITLNKVPHFEIIGEIVEYAKSMANLAPPFSIHLTRSTYELVYGSGFDVREVGGIKVPLLGSIVTYTISI